MYNASKYYNPVFIYQWTYNKEIISIDFMCKPFWLAFYGLDNNVQNMIQYLSMSIVLKCSDTLKLGQTKIQESSKMSHPECDLFS